MNEWDKATNKDHFCLAVRIVFFNVYLNTNYAVFEEGMFDSIKNKQKNFKLCAEICFLLSFIILFLLFSIVIFLFFDFIFNGIVMACNDKHFNEKRKTF